MNVTPNDRIGARIASLRRLAGMTQEELAPATQVGVAVVRAVEQGQTPASASFTAAAATALSVAVTLLTGQPYNELVCDPRSDAAAIPLLREVLDEHDDPPPIAEPMSIEELRARLDAGARLRFRSQYAELSQELPELLRQLYVHQAAPPRGALSRELLAALLDDAYSLAHTVTYRFGFLDLTARLDDRRARAAAATADPLRVAAAAFVRTDLPLTWGDYAACNRRLVRTRGQHDLPVRVPGSGRAGRLPASADRYRHR
ncbi:MAG: helix-turn-helix domain-containing protein [Pseudonocardiaceae bacterium]